LVSEARDIYDGKSLRCIYDDARASITKAQSHLLRTMLHVALIVMVTMFSIFIGAALSTIFVSGVQ
jgi:hypothetical protein